MPADSLQYLRFSSSFPYPLWVGKRSLGGYSSLGVLRSDVLRWLVFAAFGLLIVSGVVQAQDDDLPPCACRNRYLEATVGEPWTLGELWCLEQVIEDDSAGEMAFSALTTDDNGVLYATRPLAGEVYALEDSSDNLLPDTPRLLADSLTLPNGIDYHDGALYVSGAQYIYRVTLTGDVETLVDDLPYTESGYWTGDIVVGDDERIYVSAAQAGQILSYALDGSDRQLVASGLQIPYGLAFHGGELWTADSANDSVSPVINSQTAVTFAADSTPIRLASYDVDVLPTLGNTLLAVLYGNDDATDLQGYAIAAVQFDERGSPTGYDVIIPVRPDSDISPETINLQRTGFYPRRPLDIEVDAHGWVYVSILGGRIIALRHHTENERFTGKLDSCASL